MSWETAALSQSSSCHDPSQIHLWSLLKIPQSIPACIPSQREKHQPQCCSRGYHSCQAQKEQSMLQRPAAQGWYRKKAGSPLLFHHTSVLFLSTPPSLICNHSIMTWDFFSSISYIASPLSWRALEVHWMTISALAAGQLCVFHANLLTSNYLKTFEEAYSCQRTGLASLLSSPHSASLPIGSVAPFCFCKT